MEMEGLERREVYLYLQFNWLSSTAHAIPSSKLQVTAPSLISPFGEGI